MNKKTSDQNKKGCFADYLTHDEVSFSKIAAEELSKTKWANTLLNDPKINNATHLGQDEDRNYSSLNEVKSALFEVRFAYGLDKLGLTAEYEYSCGIGNSSVDFKINDGTDTWLVELTSCRESTEVKKNTIILKDHFYYCSSVSQFYLYLMSTPPDVQFLQKYYPYEYGYVFVQDKMFYYDGRLIVPIDIASRKLVELKTKIGIIKYDIDQPPQALSKEQLHSIISISGHSPPQNIPEVADIIKIQQAILSKVINKKNEPIKFPEIPNKYNNHIHMILVDMRSFNAGVSDYWDYFNIAYGSKFLINVDDGVHCRNCVDKRGNVNIVKGIFDPDHPDSRSQHIHERIHVIGFVHESDYVENELITKLKLFYNQRFFSKEQKLPTLRK